MRRGEKKMSINKFDNLKMRGSVANYLNLKML